MRCLECDYPLWNTPAGDCPECGTSFKPTDHDFRVGSVRFCCPDCDQAYYGDGLGGHLSPPQFNCVKCDRPLREDDCIIRPLDDTQMDVRVSDGLPWTRYDRNLISRWFRTVGWSMARPVDLIQQVPRNLGVGSAFLFAALTTLVSGAIGYLPYFLLFGIPAVTGGGIRMVTLGVFGLTALAFIALSLGGLFIQAGLAHLFLRITGPLEHGFARTMHVICFSTGPYALLAVPCVGLCLSSASGVWCLVIAILMVMPAQNVSGLRATLSMLLPAVLLVSVYIGAQFIPTIYNLNRMGTPGNTANMVAQPVSSLVGSIKTNYVPGKGLPSLDELQVRANANLITLPNGLDKTATTFKTEGVEGWWSGEFFVCNLRERNNQLDLVVMRVFDNRITIQHSWGSQFSSSSSSSGILNSFQNAMDSVREFNSEQWESGDPEVPISEVEKWLKSREDRSPKPEADGGSDSGSDSNADAGSKPDTTEGSGTDPDSSSDPS